LPVQIDALGLLVFFVPAEAQPLQALENGVDRGIGVALDIGIVDSQLKIKVRALPTWRKPVGDGANRTLGLPEENEFMRSGYRDSVCLNAWTRRSAVGCHRSMFFARRSSMVRAAKNSVKPSP